MPEFKSNSMTLGEFPNLSAPYPTHLEEGDNDSAGFPGLSGGLSEIIQEGFSQDAFFLFPPTTKQEKPSLSPKNWPKSPPYPSVAPHLRAAF